MATRKENFMTYMKAHPDKLKGKTLEEAYAAMRRNVVATSNRAGKINSSPAWKTRSGQQVAKDKGNAISRRLERAGFKPATNYSGTTLAAVEKAEAKRAPKPRSRAMYDARYDGSVLPKKSKPAPKKTVVNSTDAIDRYRRNKYGQNRSA